MAMEQMKNQSSSNRYELKQVDIRLVLKEGTSLYSTREMNGPTAAVDVMKEAMKDLDREMVCVVNLDQRMRPINYHVVSIGGISESIVPIQNVYKSGILSNAAAIIMLHNHPSGEITPSSQDQIMTKRIVEAGKLMNIPIMDHVIIGGGDGAMYSFREHFPEMFDQNINLEYIEQMTSTVHEKAPRYKGDNEMLNRKEFFDYMKDNVKDYLPPSYDTANIQIQQVTKHNDMRLTGISIQKEGETLTPNIYLDPLYRAYRGGKPLDDCVASIADMRIEHEDPQLKLNIQDIKNYEAIKGNLKMIICDPETNGEILNNLAYTNHGDFAAYYAVVIGETEDGVASSKVTKQMLDTWGIDVDQLHQDALASERAGKPALYSMEEMMEAMLFGNGKEAENLLGTEQVINTAYQPMFCLTNDQKLDGASLILNEDIMKQVGDFVGGDFHILPSSIHEVLILPDLGFMDAKELTNMVHEVNSTQVEPEDRLSDKVQFYDQKAGVMENALKREHRLEQEKEKEPKGLHGKIAKAKMEISQAASAKAQTKSNVKTAEQAL